MSGERKLHIGGTVVAPGWEVLNAISGSHVDHVGNANDLSRFSDGSFAELYASHVLEHFDYSGELQAALNEWNRVLRPGGTLFVSVPDLDVLAALVLDKNLNGDERFMVMRMMFGGHVDEYDYHRVGLNQEFLNSYLAGAGFATVTKVDEFGIFRDTSGMRYKGVLISLNVMARKPLS